jgi:hypothetical protein
VQAGRRLDGLKDSQENFMVVKFADFGQQPLAFLAE